jgi:hypothetical protein
LTSPLDPLTAQRLAFIRFLYEQGLSQAGQPDPLSATAVLSFHDAVESFLRLAGEHLKVNLPTGVNFADYWARLQPHLPGQVGLPSKNPMDRMNKLRVGLKHHGTIPSRTAIDQARADVTTFFTDATQVVFGIDFAAVDLIDMVTRKETAQALRDAQTHADAGDYVAAMAGLVIAFDDLIDHYSRRHHSGYGDAFSFGPTLREISSFGSPAARLTIENLDDHIIAMTTVAATMQRAMRMIALGIDYRRYVQFDILTPAVYGTMDGTIHITFSKAQEELTSQEDYQTCKRFVIESALQAAQADAALDAGTRHLQINRPEPGSGWTRSHRTWTGPATAPDTSGT